LERRKEDEEKNVGNPLRDEFQEILHTLPHRLHLRSEEGDRLGAPKAAREQGFVQCSKRGKERTKEQSNQN